MLAGRRGDQVRCGTAMTLTPRQGRTTIMVCATAATIAASIDCRTQRYFGRRSKTNTLVLRKDVDGGQNGGATHIS